MTGKLRYLPRSFDRCTLAEKLEVAAANVERARENGIAEHLAGWEHLVIREALTTLSTPTEDARERVKVPRIATTEMVEAGAQFAHIMDLWTAMVEAAPSTPPDDCAELLREARWYVNDSLEAHEHSDGRDLLTRIDTALGKKETDRHG